MLAEKGGKLIKNKPFRDFYKRKTKHEIDTRLHEYVNDRIIGAFMKKLEDRLINTPSGVHISRMGYFYVHMVPFNVKNYTFRRVGRYYLTFIATYGSIFKYWTMDYHFSSEINSKMRKRLKEGYRYLNMMRGLSSADYFHVGVYKRSWQQHQRYKRVYKAKVLKTNYVP
ncbi:MAG: hypothetical protein LBM02_10105 [Lachnospiraceae bacterium]|jgi:hypothetical protein|nr:hypothetical protein [Lachnospiraceae bacterium]